MRPFGRRSYEHSLGFEMFFPGTLYLLSVRTDRVEHSDNTSSSSLEREKSFTLYCDPSLGLR